MLKKVIFIVLAAIILIGGFLAWQSYVHYERTKDWKTYRNEEYGFEFKYPTDASFSEGFIERGFYNGENHFFQARVFLPSRMNKNEFSVSVMPFNRFLSEDIPTDFAFVNSKIMKIWNANGMLGGMDYIVIKHNGRYITLEADGRFGGFNKDILATFHIFP